MTHLHIMPEDDPGRVLSCTHAPERVREQLHDIGVRFERWSTPGQSADGASPDEVRRIYDKEIARLCREGGYELVDVARMCPDPDDPDWPRTAYEARRKFLEEHFHTEDEVRFFAEGSGCFYLHCHGRVYALVCTAGDLVSVPEQTVHWFDMGERPHFTAVRFFQKEDGWIGNFLPDSIASRFPTLDELNSEAG